MKLPNSLIRLAVALFLVSGALQIGIAAEDANSSLEALRKKVMAKEAERTQPTQQNGQFSNQIRLLQGLIARAEFQKAEEMLGNVRGYGIPPEFQEEWMQLIEVLERDLEKMQAESLAKWRTEVDQLVIESKKACLNAKTSAELDPLLLQCAALQMRRDQRNNILGERTNRKLVGTAATLTAWTNYLDFRDAGNVKRANETLRSLQSNDSQFPLLTSAEIESRYAADDLNPPNAETVMIKVFTGVKTPDDIPAALERLQGFMNPQRHELGSLVNDKTQMEALLIAWEAAKKGNEATATEVLSKSYFGYESTQRYYKMLRSHIFSRLFTAKAQKWTKLTPNPEEDSTAFLERTLSDLQAKGDFLAMIEVMKFSDRLNLTPGGNTSNRDRSSLEHFLAAQRFEAAGDILAAITNYRIVVALPLDKYTPTSQSEEALKRLATNYPDMIKNYEGAIMEELRGLRQQIQLLLGRSSGGHFPPYPGQ